MFRKYVLKKPAVRHARIGAFYATLVPVIIGMILLLELARWGLGTAKAINLVIAVNMLFGAPIVALLSQIAISKRQKFDYWGIVEIALLRATIVQVGFGALYLLFYTLKTQDMASFTQVLTTSIIAHPVLWFTITLPLTLICALIFRLSAMRRVYG